MKSSVWFGTKYALMDIKAQFPPAWFSLVGEPKLWKSKMWLQKLFLCRFVSENPPKLVELSMI